MLSMAMARAAIVNPTSCGPSNYYTRKIGGLRHSRAPRAADWPPRAGRPVQIRFGSPYCHFFPAEHQFSPVPAGLVEATRGPGPPKPPACRFGGRKRRSLADLTSFVASRQVRHPCAAARQPMARQTDCRPGAESPGSCFRRGLYPSVTDAIFRIRRTSGRPAAARSRCLRKPGENPIVLRPKSGRSRRRSDAAEYNRLSWPLSPVTALRPGYTTAVKSYSRDGPGSWRKCPWM